MTDQTKFKNMAVALDIGTTKVCAIAGYLNEYGKLEIVSVGTVKSEGVSRGVVSNIDKTVKAIREAVDIAEKTAGCKFKLVHVGIAGQHIKSLHHHGLLVRHDSNTEINQGDIDKLIKDMYKLVLPPGDKILHVVPQEYTVDDEQDIFDPIGMSGVRLEANFHIITGQITASRNILRCVEKAGLEVADVTLEPIASAASILSDEEKEAGVALIDIGGGTTDITIFKDGIIRHTCVIPFGGNVITRDIREGCTVMNEQAEKLKQKFGSALAEEIYDNRIITIPGFKGRDHKEISEKNLARIIQARAEEIFDYVLWEIRRSGYESKLIAGMVLTGGGALLKNIDLLAEYHTGLPSRVGQPVEHLAHGYTSQIASPIYATAVGLLKYSIDNKDNAANAYVEEFKSITSAIQEDKIEKINPGDVYNDNDEPEDNTDEGRGGKKGKGIFNKLFTFTKDFFETVPDSEF
ncbi:MAG: cell division protein FtsA [Saprospiraceae bacterium]|nr:cell division protein FtsA [Saprospiraceae bacterium]MBK6565448.1 cell division protein FtsA [Saprospiraceae bacterium]MBK8079971.1 cell division protein FtsA [Saprospiraceae bacterium]MBK8546196.1 cell division protein FtsA [Saprospiraceae bacterium]MBK8818288.1 cell division protein FtsA [Saprospiraceae bacterium]